jgi:hypothetical protein
MVDEKTLNNADYQLPVYERLYKLKDKVISAARE